MRIPVSWLRDHIDVPEDPADLAEFADALTMAGLEVEEILDTPEGPTFYTKITPNRGDWASVYGVAREASAVFPESRLKPLPVAQTTTMAADLVSVTIEEPIRCPRYTATIVRGVRIGPTPAWMQQRLAAALGDRYRPINNVADITNYVMLDLGQPLHAFDLATLHGGAIVVRGARAGETLRTLDGVDRALTPGVLAICDADRPIAIAGVMGGMDTEITKTTVDVLIEAAHFDPLTVRASARAIGLTSEASYRFERFVDPDLAPIAADRAARLIAEIAGGEVVPGRVDAYPGRTPPRRVMARVDRIRKLLGADVDRDIIIAGLERLGLSVERSAGALDCLIPSWRPDLTIEDDIAEEVGRISLGYAHLPEKLPPVRSGGGKDSPRGRFQTAVRETLLRAGLQDALTHSLVAPSPLATPDETAHRVIIRSALSPELSTLRTSLIPNLLGIAARAHSSGVRDIAVFEVGPVYRREDDGSYLEPLRVAAVFAGSAMPAAWSVKPDALPMDFYFAKGVGEELLTAFGVRDLIFQPTEHPITHPGRTASVSANGVTLGIVAELSETVAEAHDLPRRTCILDLDADALHALAGEIRARYTHLPRYPVVVRDVAPIFDQATPYADVARVAEPAAGPLLESLRLADVYQGANLGANRKSLTLRFTFRAHDRTLRDAEVDAALAAVRAALESEAGAEFRG
jgi:phenylalanyl-tRNA synthetase beta chain